MRGEKMRFITVIIVIGIFSQQAFIVYSEVFDSDMNPLIISLIQPMFQKQICVGTCVGFLFLNSIFAEDIVPSQAPI
jgi:hypothetical protein